MSFTFFQENTREHIEMKQRAAKIDLGIWLGIDAILASSLGVAIAYEASESIIYIAGILLLLSTMATASSLDDFIASRRTGVQSNNDTPMVRPLTG